MYCTVNEAPVHGHMRQGLYCRQHGMPAEHFLEDASYKGRRSVGDTRQHQGIPARHWHSAPEEEEQGDSLDAFVVETRLVPVSLSQIPDRLPDKVSLGSQSSLPLCILCAMYDITQYNVIIAQQHIVARLAACCDISLTCRCLCKARGPTLWLSHADVSTT